MDDFTRPLYSDSGAQSGSSMDKLEAKTRFLYHYAPIGIWEEDWSKTKALFDSLTPQQQKNFEQYLKQDPARVEAFKHTTQVISVNPAALHQYGYCEDEHDLFLQEYDVYIADFLPDLIRFSQGEYVSTSVSEETGRFGKKLIFRDTYCIPEDYRHDWRRVICISQEISQTLQHERIVDEQVRHLEMAAAIAKIGYWNVGLSENAKIQYSGQYLQLMELESQDAITQSDINKIIHPEDLPKVLNTFKKADTHLQDYSIDYRVITPKGKLKYIHEIGQILANQDGKTYSHHGIIQDISTEVFKQQQLESAKQKINQLKEQFMGAINALTVGIGLFDSNNKLIKSNNYLNSYFNEFDIDLYQPGLNFHEAIKSIIQTDDYKNNKEQKQQDFQQWFISNSEKAFEYYDNYSWLSLHKETLADNSYAITLSDISELKEREHLLHEKQQELERLATKDALTNIYNRRKFNESLNHEFRRSMRNKEPLSLIMCDVDFFKNYNDNYGHISGDQCLQQVAEAIHQCFNRVTDIVARYGGEEFAIILPNTDQLLAEQLAAKMLAAVKDKNIPHQGSKIGDCVTVSVGVTTMNNCLQHSQIDLIDCADKALYTAKEQGRNCMCSNLCL
ncbi:diguanylate cyclase [Dasania sp. GY-MA-18]|uniref:diguanylate cyclase n=1 Tax=Dasania phycosphaerae TaxID=2950436 RepID=A0A9J6RHC4_9GAMM|nr:MULTISPECIES: diguanylate cyclase [Dasania]MCR8921423.1 diguanylate cyclase [Dasania sp. GY-MA-18]MCZ0863851.1 diguanylate cyclase [Dasania phycosphaerae]MCZ0867579.1 diguanylate cyclase [Dasania phycosphaerae]